MKYSGAKVGILEETNAMKVLLALKKEGNISRAVLYNLVSKSNRTVMVRVNELIEAGLIKEYAQQTSPFSRYLELTEKGEKVAECVERLEIELSNK